MTLDHYVRCKSNMALNMATNTSIYSTVQSNLMMFVSILSFHGQWTHLDNFRCLWANCIIMKFNSTQTQNQFYGVKFSVSLSASISMSWVLLGLSQFFQFDMDNMLQYKEVHNVGSCIKRICIELNSYNELAATLRGSRPGVQSASLIMTS